MARYQQDICLPPKEMQGIILIVQKVKKMNKLELAVLDIVAFDSEPLHIIIHFAMTEEGCSSPLELVKPIVRLTNEGYLDFSMLSVKHLKKLDRQITEEEITQHIKNNFMNGVYEYPEEDDEYFFETNEKGRPYIADRIVSLDERPDLKNEFKATKKLK
jgi:hypothetical protein